MGCIDKNECGYVFNYVCGTDPDCQPIGETYLDACEYILNGSVNSGTCTDDCRWGLTAYLDYVYPDVDSQNPDDYCNCAADNEDCDSKGGNNIQKYLHIHTIYTHTYTRIMRMSANVLMIYRYVNEYGMY